MDIGINLSINGSNVIGSTGLTPPLDDYTGAQTAYSIARKLRTAYAGSAIRVRESSGDTELDIGFDADGNLDETALLAHTGANSGYVTTAYDQSGTGKDWTQSTAANQPRIVNAGVVDLLNGKPVMVNDNSDVLALTTLGCGSTCTVFSVQKLVTGTRSLFTYAHNRFIAYALDSSTSNHYSTGTPTTYVNGNSIGVTRNDVFDNVQAQTILSFINANFSTWTDINFGGNTNAYEYMQEAIIYNSDKSSDRAAIEANINEYYSIY